MGCLLPAQKGFLQGSVSDVVRGDESRVAGELQGTKDDLRPCKTDSEVSKFPCARVTQGRFEGMAKERGAIEFGVVPHIPSHKPPARSVPPRVR